MVTIALVGNPNSGKTSVFNRLTGLHQRTGNYPGVTVEKREATIKTPGGTMFKVVDLPGAYSLHATSEDERVVLKSLLAPNENFTKPDHIVYIADSTNLERHLLLFTQVADLGYPVSLCLTMTDLAETEMMKIDIATLEKELKVPVFTVNGRTGGGLDALLQMLDKEDFKSREGAFFNCSKEFYDLDKVLTEVFKNDKHYQNLLVAHHHHGWNIIDKELDDRLDAVLEKQKFESLRFQVEETMTRFGYIVPLVKKVVTQNFGKKKTTTDKIDEVLTHPFWGTLIFALVLLMAFQATFSWAAYPMAWIDSGFAMLNSWLKNTLPDSFLTQLLCDGFIAGINGVATFVPQITILFFLITLLEESGYMARAVFLSDGLMRKFGLNGRSMVSLFSGVACAVPAIMASRSITNWKERLITILVTPFISCSARIPVFTLLIALAVPNIWFFGILPLQGLVMFGLYFLGVSAALFSAFMLNKVLHNKELSYLAMELPSYKKPDWKNVFHALWNKVSAFVFGAGKIILIISMLLWVLGNFGPPGKQAEAEKIARAEWGSKVEADSLEKIVSAEKIRYSYIGYMGWAIEPVISPLGYDWKIGIAVISSFAAREVFVGTMSTIYSVGNSDDDTTPLMERLRKEKRADGRPLFGLATVASLLLFYLFAMQCVSTIAVVRREANSWKWATFQLIGMSSVAYLAALIAYQLLK